MNDFFAYIMAYRQKEHQVAIDTEELGFINWC